ncbi:four-carbon acid sugar kinase family protein [Thermotoga sp. 2812B]|uniref:four-carbon acid sugar kinase family protein n=1 Tax=Thermotoga sp. 2812B TaxID=1157948 RepID=UPI002100D590|nr:four-carbon acid sugar kinase family protein [Thermotoga sp. 2812B]
MCTNSRAMAQNMVEKMYKEITGNLLENLSDNFVVICRGDSTLRGHYPLESNAILEVFQDKGFEVDGEILIPFFKEGGRITIGGIHYVLREKYLIPVNETEFAKDLRFGYKHADLRKWVEEKTKGSVKAKNVTTISLEILRKGDIRTIESLLMRANNLRRIVVDAIDYLDLKVFCIALLNAIMQGKRFIFRTAASFVPIISGVQPSHGVDQNVLLRLKRNSGGLIIVSSYTNVSTRQLEKLKELERVLFREIDVQNPSEMNNLISFVNQYISDYDICIFTPRRYLKGISNSEIHDTLKQIVNKVNTNISYLIVKGGSTSYTLLKELNKKEAVYALGAIVPGVPVVLLDENSRFGSIPYVIFPGNVGKPESLAEVVKILNKV